MNIKIGKNIPLVCFGINLILISIIIVFFKPLINTWDDVIIMYSFSGGFDTPPTELVDYNWVWHFLLGLIIKNLFILVPTFNWYTALLIFFHWVSSSLILIFFLKAFRPINAVLYFAIFFLIFETTLLLSLNFTNTSIILAIAANVILIDKLYSNDFKKTALILPFILIALSGLLRFHTWIFVEIILCLIIFYFQRKKAGIYIALKLILLIFIVLLFTAHKYYYKLKVPGWEQKENISQIFYSHYNSPKNGIHKNDLFKDSIEYEFFYNSFLYDTLMLSSTRLKAIATGLSRVRKFSNPEDKEKIYWSFINGRLYFIILLLPLIILIIERKWILFKKVLPFLCLSLLLYIYLLLFRKITEPIFMGFITANWLIYFLFLSRENIIISRLSKVIFTPLVILSLVWGGIRLYKINLENIKKYNDWICFYDDLKRNSSLIHVAVSSESPIDYFSILDNPVEFPINNFLSFSHFNITVYEEKKKRFGMKNVTDDFIRRSDIVLTGPKISSLKLYYRNKYFKNVDLVKDSVHYNCANVYRVVSK